MSDEIILKTEDVSYDDDEDIEEVDDFDYTGYEVVRREFYAHLYDAAVNFKMIVFNLIPLVLIKLMDCIYIY